MAKNIYGISLADIIPSSITSDPQVLAMIAALDPEIDGVSGDIKEALIYPRIGDLPENILDLLAWQWHVDFYEPEGMDVEKKRNIVKSALMVHRKKGTPWAVRRLLADLGFQIEYSEWWQFGGEPFVDRLKVWADDDFDLSRESRNLIMLAWNLTKAARTHLESLKVGLWFLDEYPEISDVLSTAAVTRFLDIFPWAGLRYGYFIYGEHAPCAGTRYYGEDSPDILCELIGGLDIFDEPYGTSPVYGEVMHGCFTYESPSGIQDLGGGVTISKPLVYGKFGYGGGKHFGGKTVKEEI
jgi:phage tail P2-like protein